MSQWTKVHRGFYRLDGTNYAVAASFANSADPDQSGDFIGTPEWAVIRFSEADIEEGRTGSQDGANEDWYPTMRDAKAAAERMAS